MFEQLGMIHPLIPPAVGLLVLLVGAATINLIVKRVWVGTIRAFARRSKVTWDDVLIRHHVFGRLVQVLPALIVFVGVPFVPGLPEGVAQVIRKLAMAYMVLMLMLTMSALLSAANTIYAASQAAMERPLKGFVQLVQIVIWVLGGLLIIAVVLDRSPLLLLSGFGAMTAILLLLFRDTILSLVASVQLTAQDMVRVGDWIEMPQFGADGDVIDVQLHTVKVQNWDKTITTIPTNRLITDSFKNWRGMSQTGARRIKRAIFIDVSSIRIQTQVEVDHFTRFALLRDYIKNKELELADYNAGLAAEVDADVNRRRLTNVGTFRAYAYNYLKNHPSIHNDMTLIVRQLAPGPEGLPLEIYCFTNTTEWADYEDIQSDIFDHLFAIVPEFGLRVYQKPAGSDLENLKSSGRGVRLTPKPVQQPYPELWLGGMFPYTIQRAGRSADAWCSDPFPLEKETWKSQVALYREAAAKAGRRANVVLMRDGWVAPTRAEAEQIFGSIYVEEMLFYFRHGILNHHPDFESESDFTVESCFQHTVAGSPQECREQLDIYAQEYDVDYMVMRFRLPAGPDRERVLDCIRLFGDEVLPHFHNT